MSTSGADGVKGVLGGIFAIAVVGGVIYLKFMRAEMRADRRDAKHAAFVADQAEWKNHALEMMKQAPDQRSAGEYLVWGVDTYHSEAEADASDGPEYRDLLIEKIYERARQDGREDVTRSLDKVKMKVKLANPGEWWVIEKGKK